MKPHIHFYSDCAYFAGCENMLANFFNNEELRASYQLSFSYRRSQSYQQGLTKRLHRSLEQYPLSIVNIETIIDKFKNRISRKIVRLVLELILFRYIALFVNTVTLFRFFRQRQITLLHINNGGYPGAPSCMAAVLAAKWTGTKTIIYVVNNIVVDYKNPWRWLDYPIDRLVAKRVACFITGSKCAADRLKHVLKLHEQQVQYIYNGIHPRVITEDALAVRKRLNIDESRLLMGIIAVHEKRKGHIYLLQAMKILQQTQPILPLLIIEGSGPETAQLKQFVLQNHLQQHVIFVAPEAHIFNLLHSLDILVLPSIMYEDFPNVVLEAMSCSKPVIGTYLAGIPEQIAHEITGLLVEPQNAVALADAIHRLSENSELRTKMASAAKEVFEKKFTAEQAVKHYSQLYAQYI